MCGRCLRLRRCGEGGQCVYENTTKTGRKRDRVESRKDSGRDSSSTGSPEEDEEVEVVERTVARRTSVDSAMSTSSITKELNSMAAVVSPRSLDWIPGDQELLRHYDDMTSEGLLIGPESAHYHTNVLRLAQKASWRSTDIPHLYEAKHRSFNSTPTFVTLSFQRPPSTFPAPQRATHTMPLNIFTTSPPPFTTSKKLSHCRCSALPPMP